MKLKIIFGIFLMVLFGCVIYGDNSPRGVKLIWDQNPDAESVVSYEVYFWQGDDTLSWSIPGMSYSGIVAHLVGADTAFFVGYQFSYNYIRGGVIAVDNLGRRSGMGYSDFVGYYVLFGPSVPGSVRVLEE